MAGLLDASENEIPTGAEEAPAQEEEFDYDAQLKEIDAGMPEDLRDPWDKLMTAGLRFLNSNKGLDMIDNSLRKTDEVGDSIGKGSARIIALIQKESQGQVPPQLFIPGAVAMAIHVAKYVNERGERFVPPVELAKAMESAVYETLKLNNIPVESFDNFIDQNAERAP